MLTDQPSSEVEPRSATHGAETHSDSVNGAVGEVDTDVARELLTAPRKGAAVPRSGDSAGRDAVGAERAAEGGSRPPTGGGGTQSTNNVSPSQQNSSAHGVEAQERRKSRYENRRALWDLTGFKRVAKCGRALNGTNDGYAALVVNNGVAHWSGVCVCGSIWACPVCSAKIRATRADEIARAVANHIMTGGNAWLVTLTARHRKYHSLEPLFEAISNGWRKLMSGKAWAGDKKRGQSGEKDRLGVRGWIRSMEVTYGHRNGWHPHLHVVLLTRDETANDLMAAMARWDSTWRKWMARHGFEPDSKHGIRWDHVRAGEKAGDYIAKTQEGKGHLGNEIARGDLKRGRLGTVAPFELLEYFRMTGDLAVKPIWREYEDVTHGRRAMTWSRGLRKELLEDERERSDEEIAEDEIGGEIWAFLPADSFKIVQRTPGLQADLLTAAEQGFGTLIQVLTDLHLDYIVGQEAPVQRKGE